MYKIRKQKIGPAFQFSGQTVCFFTCFVTIWISSLIVIMLQAAGIINLGGEINKGGIGVWIIFFIQLIVMSILGFIDIKMLKIYFSKNLKKNGKGTIKKVKISSIEEIKRPISFVDGFNLNSKTIRVRGDSFNGYFLEAEHGHVIYCSDGIKKSNVQEALLTPDFSKLYKSYGYEYDEKETHKKEVLHEIDKDIIDLQHKIDCGGFFNSFSAKKELASVQHERELIEAGYQPSYLVVNGHKISVGDTVDVYINPDDEKNYWMDIDFLFDK